jgi:serine/threonine protein kinase
MQQSNSRPPLKFEADDWLDKRYRPSIIDRRSVQVILMLSSYIKSTSDYERIRFLGKGGVGEVWLCREKETGREVAIKTLAPIADTYDSKLFLREVIIPMRMNLPGVIQLVGFQLPDAFQEESGSIESRGAAIITEYMAHGSLEEVIGRIRKSGAINDFGATEIMKCIFGIAATMAEVHSKGVIHRDLNLSNVFLDAAFEPRIADFGLSRMYHNSMRMTMAIGTPIFMAPELINETDTSYDQSVDVYAYGVLLYRLFTPNMNLDDGRVTRSVQQMMLRILRGTRFKQVPEIPAALWDLIQRCWAQLPADRPSFKDIVELLQTNSELILSGTNLDKYRRYQKRLAPTHSCRGYGKASGDGVSPKRPRSGTTGGGGLTFAKLAAQGIITNRSPPPSGGKVRRYDFTRSKLKTTDMSGGSVDL